MIRGYYILKDREPVLCDLMTWADWIEGGERIVKQENISDIKISTVFLGLDHQWGKGPPLLFETMIFGGELDMYQDRCTTWEQAEAMHAKAVAKVKGEK